MRTDKKILRKHSGTIFCCVLLNFRFRHVMRPIRFFVKTQEYNILSIHSSLISFKTNIEQKEGEKSKMKNAVRKQPDRKVKRKRKNMEESTDVKIPIETWMRSQDISGFPNLTIQILDHLDLDSLINCRQVSMTFKNFLDTNFGLDFWIGKLCLIRKKYYLTRVRLGLVYLKPKDGSNSPIVLKWKNENND